MKKVKQYNATLLVLMAFCGLLLGVAVVFFVLTFFDARQLFVIGGFACTILGIIVAFFLPGVTHKRDEAIEKVNRMVQEFGREVNFVDEKTFLKIIANRRSVSRLYALHVELAYSVGELKRKEVGYALAEALDELALVESVVGYDEYGNFIFFTMNKEREFVGLLKSVEDKLLANPSLPTLALLLGASASEGDYPKMIEEAVTAACYSAEIRNSLDLVIYDEAKVEEITIDLTKEQEQGRLSYYVLPFGNEESEEKVNVFSPCLYDSYRGNITGKDLFHALMLSKALKDLDDISIKRVKRYLADNPDSGALFVRLSIESARNATFLADLAKDLDEAGVDKNRLILAYSSLEMGDKAVAISIRKARPLGFRIGVYDYGGEAIDPLITGGVSYAMIKPELLRSSSDPEYLVTLTNALYSLNILPLIEKGVMGEGLSAIPPQDIIRLEDLEEEPPVEEEAAPAEENKEETKEGEEK